MIFLKTVFKLLSDFWQTKVWAIKGVEISSQKSCKLIFAGSEVQKNYIEKIVYDSSYSEDFLGNYYFWSLYRFIKKSQHKYDMIFIEGHTLHQLFYKNKLDYFIPLWLTTNSNIPLTPQNNSSKEDARRTRKYKLTYKIASTTEEYHHFYHSMYVPTIGQRHADRKILMPYKKMINEISNCGGKLLLIKNDEETIAGVIIITKGQTPVLWSGGILDSKSKYRKMGALAATYLFPSHYLSKKGYNKMNMGLTRSFLSDGVLQNKKKWNVQFSSIGIRGFILKTNNYTDGVKGFLTANPFAYIDKKNLNGVVFIDTNKSVSELISKCLKTYNLDTFKEFNVFQFEGSGTKKVYGNS